MRGLFPDFVSAANRPLREARYHSGSRPANGHTDFSTALMPKRILAHRNKLATYFEEGEFLKGDTPS
jgi:hypothetical protein